MTCPTCGHLASREVLIVHRPGLPSVTRVIIRCVAVSPDAPRSVNTRVCPLLVLEAPLGEPLPDPPPAKPRRVVRPVTTTRTCCDCGTSLTGKSSSTRRCEVCIYQQDLRRARERVRRSRGTDPDAPVRRPTTCLDCGVDISCRHGRALRCIDCADQHATDQARERARRSRKRTEVPA